ncbi:MAG: hypothetical protein GW795_07805 [Cyanobacteria bacterium]|nr:hypothetical protein [Cyanobacteria bacterium CG_2015-16_32_12]NCO78608.1 hypothetical protein [Cyanobacteria bacterium CG_2015-22_32_23]NCQ03000.1 hypothetical protein [Cyanobacteria bacterium CG_2015-09_32_10]NCQ41784.1 hypothetical protein [Cyanobacteria bacterium CG_2015-04_32_10]NCS83691.1 hypothetical protein [Cyanobacteria bacterium CG_2015-02_32_10]
MKIQSYHIAHILELHNKEVPDKNILFPLGRHIKNKYMTHKGKLPEKEEFESNEEKFIAFAYPESQFDFILTHANDFLNKININSINLDW